ncbi:hypothetical protein Ocin01_11525 [Orchesella cincta]|uniref:Uncharacterized protein n=1 Tax=Orchesella cincta TaxID=48709 RepID=A0A1D2MQ14_ORCCI|nr:hypothetical protein Ocin01_11525 [Orchesella cincta]
MPLQKGVKVLAIIDAVLSTLNLGMYVLAIVGLHVYDDELDTLKRKKCCHWCCCCCHNHLNSSDNAALQKRLSKLRIWIIVTVIVVIINIASLILNSTSGEYAPAAFGITVFLICYKIFETVVVISFLRTLGTDGQTGNGLYIPLLQSFRRTTAVLSSSTSCLCDDCISAIS